METGLTATQIEKKQPEPKPFEKWAAGFYRKLMAEDDSVWKEIYSVAELVARFIEGKQLLRKSTYGSGWRVIKVPDDMTSGVRSINVMRFYAHNILVKWTQSRAKLVARAAKDTDQAKMAARAADVVINHYDRKWYDAFFRQREALRAMATGNIYRRVYYSSEADGGKAEREVIEMRSLNLGDGPAQCLDCGNTGTVSLFQTAMPDATGQPVEQEICPQCGSVNIQAEPIEQAVVPVVTGKEEYECGEIVCESVPIFNVRHSLHSRLEDSEWLICRRDVRREVLESKYPGIRVGHDEQDDGLRARRDLARTGAAVMGSGAAGSTGQSEESVEFVELWLDPSMYGNVTIASTANLIGGVTIQPGALKDQFPRGMCIVGFNGLKTIIGVYDEHHRDHWVSGQFHVKPESGVGDGLADMVEVQKRFNFGDSQMWTYLRTSATPATMYDKDLLSQDEAKYLGHPQRNIPVDLSKLPETRRLSDAVHQLSPQAPATQLVGYVQGFLNNMFQLTSHVTDFAGGLPGVDNSTATGAQIASSLANSMQAPQLEMLADVDRRTKTLALRLYQKHFPDKRWFALADRHDAQDGVFLKGADLCTDIVLEVVPESYLPENSVVRQERLQQFLLVCGGLQGVLALLQVAPEALSRMTELYRVDLGIDEYGVAAQVGRRRIEQMKAGLQQIEEMAAVVPGATGVSPLMFLTPTPDPHEPGHLAAVNYYRNWMLTDEGLDAQPELRMAVSMLIDLHMQFAALVMEASAMVQGTGPPEEGEDEQGESKKPGKKSGKTASQKSRDAGRANMKQPSPGAMNQ